MIRNPSYPLGRVTSDASGLNSDTALPRLALDEQEAADALGISKRLLVEHRQLGRVPHARIGKRIVYSVDGLREWLTSITQAVASPPPGAESWRAW